VGFASLTETNDEGEVSDETHSGFGLAAWVGCDFWVSKEWSLGVAGRLTYASVSASSGGASEDINAWIPGVLFTATYH
jgi:hypothetical protein